MQLKIQNSASSCIERKNSSSSNRSKLEKGGKNIISSDFRNIGNNSSALSRSVPASLHKHLINTFSNNNNNYNIYIYIYIYAYQELFMCSTLSLPCLSNYLYQNWKRNGTLLTTSSFSIILNTHRL